MQLGPLGRGGARRRTRRRWKRRMSLMLSAQQKAQIRQQTGKNPDEMTNDELDEAITTAGIDLPDEEPDYLDELEKLAGLKEKGVITEEEFEAKKKQLMGL
ncbi:SHOCT domain-containing protein [Methanovulcanius yangii]|uniref:SHOCT domain-containing protein n=1 Tax=Methanovulcanius yangii TaxID=1789227 RepID=UPI0029CA396E|nr:SHOCT domain-containing protein [Methanovulcanius yangii]